MPEFPELDMERTKQGFGILSCCEATGLATPPPHSPAARPFPFPWIILTQFATTNSEGRGWLDALAHSWAQNLQWHKDATVKRHFYACFFDSIKQNCVKVKKKSRLLNSKQHSCYKPNCPLYLKLFIIHKWNKNTKNWWQENKNSIKTSLISSRTHPNGMCNFYSYFAFNQSC